MATRKEPVAGSRPGTEGQQFIDMECCPFGLRGKQIVVLISRSKSTQFFFDSLFFLPCVHHVRYSFKRPVQ